MAVDKATMRHFDALCLEVDVPDYPEASRILFGGGRGSRKILYHIEFVL